MDLSAYLDLFVAEAREHIAAAYDLASKVDQPEGSEEGMNDLFRHVHSVKGMAASMGFSAMSSLAHDAESLMERLRQGHGIPQRGARHILCDTLACLERMVDRAERKESVDDDRRAELQEGLRSLLGGASDASETKPVADPGGSARPAGIPSSSAPAGCVTVAVIVRRDRAFPAVRAAVVLGRLAKLGKLLRTEPPMAELRTGRFDGRLLATLVSDLPLQTLASKIASLDEVENFTLVPAQAPPEKTAPPASKSTLRVRADRLDALLEDVLELMSSIGRVQSHVGTRSAGSPLAREGEAARLLARRAYDALVEMRLVPFEVATQRLRRTADELARKLGKTVTLEVEGEDVRVDRSLLERLLDPLLHMVRNAIDHGVEHPEARRAARKAESGQIRVRLARRGSQLTLVVEDDGRGLDPRRLKQAAIERGLLTPSEAVRLGDTEALHLITLPGFSTVEETTEVSGRGVGMDVVKNAVDAMAGRLRIEASAGRGTRFELAVPASVALVQAYVVRASGVPFAVPLSALLRMAPMDDHSTSFRDGRRFWNVGSEEVPVWTLREVLGLAASRSPAGGGMALISESVRGHAIGIEVDEVVGRREIVVRPLPAPLSGLGGYSGAAIMDDGSIVLVLDPANLPLT